MEIKVGNKSPAVNLASDSGEKIHLKEYHGKQNVVLYFYPKDDTPGCTLESNEFKDNYKKFQKLDTEIIGVSPDSVESHVKFKAKFKFPFPLLADTEKKICEKFGVWVEKNMYGRKYMGVQRATFLIDKEGKIAATWPKVKVKGHVEEVLATVKKLNLA